MDGVGSWQCSVRREGEQRAELPIPAFPAGELQQGKLASHGFSYTGPASHEDKVEILYSDIRVEPEPTRSEHQTARQLADQQTARQLTDHQTARQLADQQTARQLADHQTARQLADHQTARQLYQTGSPDGRHLYSNQGSPDTRHPLHPAACSPEQRQLYPGQCSPDPRQLYQTPASALADTKPLYSGQVLYHVSSVAVVESVSPRFTVVLNSTVQLYGRSRQPETELCTRPPVRTPVRPARLAATHCNTRPHGGRSMTCVQLFRFLNI